jgi:hypothetical protein
MTKPSWCIGQSLVKGFLYEIRAADHRTGYGDPFKNPEKIYLNVTGKLFDHVVSGGTHTLILHALWIEDEEGEPDPNAINQEWAEILEAAIERVHLLNPVEVYRKGKPLSNQKPMGN